MATKTPYKQADKLLETALLNANRLFESIRAELQASLKKKSAENVKKNIGKADALGISKTIDSLYSGIDRFNVLAYEEIVPQVYKEAWEKSEKLVDTKDKKKSVLGLVWILGMLATFNLTLSYIYKDELQRKAEYFSQQITNLLYSDLLKHGKMSMYTPEMNALFKKMKQWHSTQSDTQMVTLATEAMKQAYKDAGVKRVIYRTIDDDRRSEICTELDGTIIDIDEISPENSPPQHPNCRSWLEAYE